MPPVTALYDTRGKDYSARRSPDARIAAAINRAIGDAPSIANIGAGTGSYEMSVRDLQSMANLPCGSGRRSSPDPVLARIRFQNNTCSSGPRRLKTPSSFSIWWWT